MHQTSVFTPVTTLLYNGTITFTKTNKLKTKCSLRGLSSAKNSAQVDFHSTVIGNK